MITNYKLITNKDYPLIYRVDASERAWTKMREAYGDRRYLPQVLIEKWCKEFLTSGNWKYTRPHYDYAKIVTGDIPRNLISEPPLFFCFKRASDFDVVSDEFGNLFTFTLVTDNQLTDEDYAPARNKI